MLIKKRKAKVSERGIYLQDRQLQDTIFQPSTRYKYVMDMENKQIIILSSDDDSGNLVSKRKLKDGVKPVIDIRDKKALSVFEGSDYLQVEIFDDKVIVQGYEQVGERLSSKAKNTLKRSTKQSNVVSINDILNVRKKSEIVLSKDELSKAVGHDVVHHQLSLDFGIESESQNNTTFIGDKLKDIHVPLQVASLFSGAGCLDVGFIESGFDVVFALEIDEDAASTYQRNLGNHVVCADITTYPKPIPQAPVYIGGTKCQGFSNANRRTNYLDNPDNLLVYEYIKRIQANDNLKVFVLENVPQILTTGDGQFKREIYEQLSDFEITSGVLNAADFGSPQLRKRAFFIGSKIGKIDLPKPTHSPEEYQTVAQAFEGLHNGIPNQLDFSIPRPSTIERMSYVPQGGNVFDIPENIRPKGKHSDFYKRLDPNKPSITIVNPRKANITHPDLNRSLSIRECARLNDVSDDFVFEGKLNSMQQQLANPVPVRLAKAIAKEIKNALLKFNIRTRSKLQPAMS
ncbi:DNA (cytosine-5)-methyltransferase 1 [Evansella vedderi]|uniref:DNA (cytosine-5-)-methyltransferase n=1 Tax=Evansella vedderi TaxID=38282 RepID=A0ABT9ZYF3_9BACI|nr:DNA cytosine methyltransferase [Evansella vedderi]MDQ0255503.1 DNA (cytosine-5)-methyltransferase 1 [Evansella vedderi]